MTLKAGDVSTSCFCFSLLSCLLSAWSRCLAITASSSWWTALHLRHSGHQYFAQGQTSMASVLATRLMWPRYLVTTVVSGSYRFSQAWVMGWLIQHAPNWPVHTTPWGARSRQAWATASLSHRKLWMRTQMGFWTKGRDGLKLTKKQAIPMRECQRQCQELKRCTLQMAITRSKPPGIFLKSSKGPGRHTTQPCCRNNARLIPLLPPDPLRSSLHRLSCSIEEAHCHHFWRHLHANPLRGTEAAFFGRNRRAGTLLN